jgi:hypothetical protein
VLFFKLQEANQNKKQHIVGVTEISPGKKTSNHMNYSDKKKSKKKKNKDIEL